MTDTLLQYYSRELSYLRQKAVQFAEAHPGTAARLGLAGEQIADPHMERMLESMAFLNARLEKRLDDDYPQLTESLLRRLFPHYLRSLPSMAMMIVEPDKTLKQPLAIPAGTRLEAQSGSGSLVFSTAWDLQLSPLIVRGAQLLQAPFSFSSPVSASAVLLLTLSATDPDMALSTLGLSSLSFHIEGDPSIRRNLFDLVMGQLSGIVVSGGSADQGQALPAHQLRASGEGCFLLPEPAVGFSGYQHLMEVMAYPEPFMGFTVTGLGPVLRNINGSELNIYLLLREASSELSRSVALGRFHTGCVPVVNLFPRQAEPLVLNYSRMREKVVPDAHSDSPMEVWNICQVTDITGNRPCRIPPLYGHNFNDSDTGLYWLEVGGRDARGVLHSYLSFSDIEYNPAIDSRRVFLVDTLCCNGNQPRSLAAGTALHCLDNRTLSGKASLMDSPTAWRQPPEGYQGAWALLSLLQLNYQGLFPEQHPERSLRQLLRLHMRGVSPEGEAWVEAVRSLTSEPVTAPIYIGGRHCLARGIRLHITVDPEPLKESSLHLLIATLDRLVASYAGFDRFLQLSFTLQGVRGVHTLCRRHQTRKAGL